MSALKPPPGEEATPLSIYFERKSQLSARQRWTRHQLPHRACSCTKTESWTWRVRSPSFTGAATVTWPRPRSSSEHRRNHPVSWWRFKDPSRPDGVLPIDFTYDFKRTWSWRSWGLL